MKIRVQIDGSYLEFGFDDKDFFGHVLEEEHKDAKRLIGEGLEPILLSLLTTLHLGSQHPLFLSIAMMLAVAPVEKVSERMMDYMKSIGQGTANAEQILDELRTEVLAGQDQFPDDTEEEYHSSDNLDSFTDTINKLDLDGLGE